MPDMQVLYTELSGRKLVVLGINQGESQQTVARFADEFGITFPVFLDNTREVANQYGVRAYPTTFIIDSRGVIQHVVVGGPLTRSYLRRQVDGLLQ
jgi:peroxiredoxin